MILRNGIRRSHRWLGMILTLTILANFAVRAFGEPPPLLVYSPLAPLALHVLPALFRAAGRAAVIAD